MGVGKLDLVAQEVQKYEDTMATLKGEQPQYPTWTVWFENINRILPRWRDIDRLNGDIIEKSLMSVKKQEARQAIEKKHMPTWGGTLGVTGLWIAGLLGFACWRFSSKDY